MIGLAFLSAASAASWYGMMVVHESGHVLGAWASGGRVARVVLHPLAFSRTDLAENPHPLLVVWGGPVWGSVLPLVIWLVLRGIRYRLAFLPRFFAGFCLVANGVYLASAAVMPVGDAEDLLRLGVPAWMLVAPGLAGVVGGLGIWNGIGASFGFGGRAVERSGVVAVLVLLAVLVGGMYGWSCFQ